MTISRDGMKPPSTPAIGGAAGLAIISKAFPEGAHLAMEGDGPVIDTTRIPVATPGTVELAAA